MKKWLFRIVWIPAFILAALFLIANRQMVRISLDPLNAEAPALTTIPLPLWAWLMFMLFIGIGAGALGMWVSAAPRRAELRANKKTMRGMRKHIARLEQRLRKAEEAAKRTTNPAEPPLLESEDA